MVRLLKFAAVALFFLWAFAEFSRLNLRAQEKPVEQIGCFATKTQMIQAFQQNHSELVGAKLIPQKNGFSTIRWVKDDKKPTKEWQLDYETQKCVSQPKLRLYVYRPAEFFDTTPAHGQTIATVQIKSKSTKPKGS